MFYKIELLMTDDVLVSEKKTRGKKCDPGKDAAAAVPIPGPSTAFVDEDVCADCGSRYEYNEQR